MTAGYYAYAGTAPLGQERLGSDNRMIRRDLTTDRGAVRAMRRVFKGPFRLYRFVNFYDNATFREVRV